MAEEFSQAGIMNTAANLEDKKKSPSLAPVHLLLARVKLLPIGAKFPFFMKFVFSASKHVRGQKTIYEEKCMGLLAHKFDAPLKQARQM